MSTTIRTAQTPPPATSLPEGKTPASQSTTDVEPLYTNYHQEKGIPLSAEYFGLGQNWDTAGVFEKEINTIEDYFANIIQEGDIANSSKAVKEELKKIEKTLGLQNEERSVLKIGQIVAYIEFLNKKSDLTKNIKRYGSN